MVEGPIIPKRIGGPPSDLPEKQLSYPGKPLSHRYIPTNETRIVEEEKGTDQVKLASNTPFTPIASVKYPDKNIRLGPVINVRTRDLHPVATKGSVTLPVNGSSIYEISEDLRKPLEARMSRLVDQPQTQIPDDQEVTQNIGDQPASAEPSTSLNQTSISELDNLKKLAAEELAKRHANSSQDQVPETPATDQVPTPSTEEPPTPTEVVGEQKKSPVSFSPPAPLGSVGEDTKSLLSRAQQLEADLTRLRQGLTSTSQESEHIRETGRQLEEESKAKIEHLITDRETLTQKITNLTESHAKELNTRKELEAKLDKLATGYETQLKGLVEEKDKLIALKTDRETLIQKIANLTESHAKELNTRKELEAKLDKLATGYETQLKGLVEEKDKLAASKAEDSAKYQSLESRLANMTKEFDQKLQNTQIEKTNLLDQVKKLQVSQEAIKQKDIQIDSLQKKVSQFEGEKAQSGKRYEKLEALVADLGHKPAAKPAGLVTAEPSKVAPKHEQEMSQKAARVVVPQRAVGKMAPSLTTVPNVINGIFKDPNGLLLSNVIIVVKDTNNQPVRALKSNKIGQFAISTPLPNGTYTMELESPHHSFDIIQVEVKGEVMPPIEIKALS